MWLSDSYDVPQEFREFLLTWFGSTVRITFGLPRLTILNALTQDEITVAQQLVRRNLKGRRSHIINATWALRDISAAPLLRMMLEDEPEESRRLTLAGALWRLVRDPVFLECLEQAKKSGMIASWPHLLQVLWLDDGRALDFLIDLLPQEDVDKRKAALFRLRNVLQHTPFRGWAFRRIKKHNEAQGAGPWAPIVLNNLEFDRVVPPDEMHRPSHYRQHQFDSAFRQHMLLAIHKSNGAPNLDRGSISAT
jgi:hypothetical protein